MISDPHSPFAARLAELPHLGVGISTEFEAAKTGLDPIALRDRHPELLSFLEIGIDLERGVDADAWGWVKREWPVTFHFLDLNLEDEQDLDEAWLRDTAALARELKAAWLCGDAGMFHVGQRERGHTVLMPPVLEPEVAAEMAGCVERVRVATGFEVLPENPPGHVFLGEMHLLDFFGSVVEQCDGGMLLDVAHLAMYQRVMGHDALTGLDGFPLHRVVEIHVAGGTAFDWKGRTFVEDDHGVGVLDDTWRILEHVLPSTTNLRALVLECERNQIDDVLPLFERLRGTVPEPPA